ncbi:MAG: hypothetical protein HY744_03970 [Deltaproteobacteria bacterium]|nr:hypothetical protein [Deltaproteobacteria bacterium]
MVHLAEPAFSPERLHYRRAPRPLVFPTEAAVPETKRHLCLRMLLFEILRRALADRACVGSEQFVYYDASDPSRCLAPDVFVRTGTPDFAFDLAHCRARGRAGQAEVTGTTGPAPRRSAVRCRPRYWRAALRCAAAAS